MQSNIFVSTGGYKSQNAMEVVEELSSFGLKSFELSGGKYDPKIEEKLLETSNVYNIQIHNYFPPPENPFVFNLASEDDAVRERSFKHVENAIRITAGLNKKYFSFHAGFLLDPDPKELGKRITKRKLQNRVNSLRIFLAEVSKLSSIANESDITLLIENNVVSKGNFEEFGENAFLMTEISETLEIIESVPDNVGLLVDVAHLKVSARTLNFNPIDYLLLVNPKTKAYHLSDNDGFSDQNRELTENSWFWDFLNYDAEFYTLEVYNVLPEKLISQIELVKKKLWIK